MFQSDIAQIFRGAGLSSADYNAVLDGLVEAVMVSPITKETACAMFPDVDAQLVGLMWDDMPNICGAKIGDDGAYHWVEYTPPEKAKPEPKTERMTAGEVNMAMAAIGLHHGLERPVTANELGRLLGSTGKNAGQSVQHWLNGRRKPSIAMSRLVRLLASGKP